MMTRTAAIVACTRSLFGDLSPLTDAGLVKIFGGGEDPIRIEDVDSSFRSEVLDVVDAINESSEDSISFVVLTDTHGSANGNKSQNVIRYILKNSLANKMFWLGDMSSNLWSKSEYETYREPLLKCADKIYPTFGNHEYFGSPSAADLRLLYDEFLADKTVSGSPTNYYYYIDDEDMKVRYLIINTSNGWTDQVSATQISWIASAVQVPDSTWGIVVFSHYPFNTNVSYESSSASLSIRDALLTTNGTIISHICGHGHRDFRDVIDYDFYEQVLLCDCASNQAVNVVNINLTTGAVYIYRIGSGSDIEYNYKSLPTPVYYSITNTLTGCVNTNDATQVLDGRAYSGTLNASSHYTLDSENASVTIMMNGVDVTSTFYNPSTRTISIGKSDFTGNVVITAVAEYIPPIAEFTSSGLTRKGDKGQWTLNATLLHPDMPDYLTFVIKPNWDGTGSMPTGWRQGQVCRYWSRATQYGSSRYRVFQDPTKTDGTGTNSVSVNGQRYVVFTIEKANETEAYDLIAQDIADGRTYIGGELSIHPGSQTKWTASDSWVLPVAYSSDIISRLPDH